MHPKPCQNVPLKTLEIRSLRGHVVRMSQSLVAKRESTAGTAQNREINGFFADLSNTPTRLIVLLSNRSVVNRCNNYISSYLSISAHFLPAKLI